MKKKDTEKREAIIKRQEKFKRKGAKEEKIFLYIVIELRMISRCANNSTTIEGKIIVCGFINIYR